LEGEKSYSHHASSELGVSVIDRFTFYFLQFMEKRVSGIHSHANLRDLFNSIS
jgi:phosphatidylinositol glycan class K